MDYNELNRDWLAQQLQEYQLTVEQLVERIGGGLAGVTIKRFLQGSIQWPVIPKELKNKIVHELRTIFDSPSNEEKTLHVFRSRNTYAPIIEEDVASRLIQEIEEELRSIGTSQIDRSPHGCTQKPLLGMSAESSDYCEPCGRCRKPMAGADDGRCPHCDFLSDGSQ